MNKLYAVLLSVVTVSTIAAAVLVVAVPDHNGELRLTPQVGDYYVISYQGSNNCRYTVTAIDGDQLTVTSFDGESTVEEYMSVRGYMSAIYNYNGDADILKDKRTIIYTHHGKKVCYMHVSMMNSYWTDEHNVIYRSYVGGVSRELKDTSLFI